MILKKLFNLFKKRKKFIIIDIVVENKIVEYLNKESRKQRISIDVLVEKILKKYLKKIEKDKE